MEENMKGIERLENKMDKGCGLELMEIFMKGIFLMVYIKVLEYLGGQMDKNMKEIERLGNSMEKEFGLG